MSNSFTVINDRNELNSLSFPELSNEIFSNLTISQRLAFFETNDPIKLFKIHSKTLQGTYPCNVQFERLLCKSI